MTDKQFALLLLNIWGAAMTATGSPASRVWGNIVVLVFTAIALVEIFAS